ncbi:hypothetical protein LSTR_LSTR003691 [Laodelphax striatellus]|uniref:Uncharacterized protein n=1 Tax=Laodelphax striatellus TaxID=195883 RepID=A0A482XAZ3_LAOST|nr:hypothetical protein LSTR_LSTR003691 [Laodelphax striatellus]
MESFLRDHHSPCLSRAFKPPLLIQILSAWIWRCYQPTTTTTSPHRVGWQSAHRSSLLEASAGRMPNLFRQKFLLDNDSAVPPPQLESPWQAS